MRIGKVGGRAVLVTANGSIDIERASTGRFPADVDGLYECWDELRDWTASGTFGDEFVVTGDLEMPIGTARQVFAVGANYADHIAEAGAQTPELPMIFTKFPTCLVGPEASVALPTGKVDWEVELVAVIGRTAHRVAVDEAWSYVAALTVGQDLTERPLQLKGGRAPQFSLGKSFPGFGPIGPWLVSVDEFADPDDLAIECTVTGELMQKSRTSELIFSVPELIAYLSESCSLLPGDLVFTGTPAGVGVFRTPRRYLEPGDVIESSIEGIGTLVTRIESGPAYAGREVLANHVQ